MSRDHSVFEKDKQLDIHVVAKMDNSDDSELPPRIRFIEHEAPKLHPAFSFHGKYDKSIDKFIPTGTLRFLFQYNVFTN